MTRPRRWRRVRRCTRGCGCGRCGEAYVWRGTGVSPVIRQSHGRDAHGTSATSLPAGFEFELHAHAAAHAIFVAVGAVDGPTAEGEENLRLRTRGGFPRHDDFGT